MAAIPHVDASQCSQKNERTVKGKKDKMKRVSALYHGKQRRSSERVKQNAFKKPIIGPGSSQEACFRAWHLFQSHEILEGHSKKEEMICNTFGIKLCNTV
jgi:hypothetical protein